MDIADFLRVPVIPHCLQMAAQEGRPEQGLIAEFGVYKGTSITMLAQLLPGHTIHGFDSFVGLPAEWDRGLDTFQAGHFSLGGQLPAVPANVKLYKGWFEDTLPAFVAEHGKEAFRILDIDCDIYRSAAQVLALCDGLIKPGTAIYFDELCDWGGSEIRYPDWENHEYKALQEWIAGRDRKVKALCRNGAFGAAVIVER